jgi:predicted nucleic acid-binding protein
VPRSKAETSVGAPSLTRGSLVLADSSALVYLEEGEIDSPRRAALENFLARAAETGVRLAASTVAWAELLAAPIARDDRGLADRYRILLSDSSRIFLREVDVAVAEEAAAVSASLPPALRRTISGNDLIHIATALVLEADAVLTNDEAWRSVPRCPPILLVDELAAGMEAWA